MPWAWARCSRTSSRPQGRPLEDGIGVHDVAPDAVFAVLYGQHLGHLDLGRLGCAVGPEVLAWGWDVLGADENQAAPQALLTHDGHRLPGYQEVPRSVDVHSPLPVPEGELVQGAHRGDAGVGDQDVQPAVGEAHLFEGCLHLGFVGDIHAQPNGPAVAVGLVQLIGNGLAGRLVQVGDHHVGALGRQPAGDGLAYSVGAAGNQGDLALQLLLRGRKGQLVQLQGPVLGIEDVPLADGCVPADGLSAERMTSMVWRYISPETRAA